MSDPTITEATIRSLATPESFSRGEQYYRSGMVSDIERRGDVLRAEVEGSSYTPYRVTIELDESGIISTDCTCPYDWGGCCKHIVAVLLTYIGEREEIAERPAPDELLAGLDAETLRDLLGSLLAAHGELIPWVETQITLRAARSRPAAQSSAQTPGAPARSPVDTNAIRRQVRYQMRGSDDYYGGDMVRGLHTILAQAVQALDANDGENALAIAGAIADETIPGWEEYDSDGEFGEWFSRLGAVMAEALLIADLPLAERKAWASRLEKWQAELDDYGVDDAFDAALCAAEYGWDYTPLQAAMRGEVAPDEASGDDLDEEEDVEDYIEGEDEEGAEDYIEDEDDDDEPWFADELTEAWLNVLERQGRTDEFLNLAHATGRITRYVTMLVKAGRIQEAIDYGLTQPLTPAHALALAKALRERGEHRAALRIAERGLDWKGPQAHELAIWVREVATALGDVPVALRAARRAFDESASLVDYLAAQAVAGEGWALLREELLRELTGYASTWLEGPIDIYLHEGLVDDAVRLLNSETYVDYAVLARVADAATASHPEWVIRKCQYQAESIMDAGQSQQYAHALNWLEKVRRAYTASGRTDEWRAYCEALIAKHARKYKLAPGLKELLKG